MCFWGDFMKRLLLILLAFSLVAGCLPWMSTPAQAASGTEVVRDIAIVFDNSGSMYKPMGGVEESRMAWCRATYAMEAFATMMNAKDTMYIYPMHPIEVNGQAYSDSNPLRVTQKNAATIRDIYTPEPWGTPIETISIAYEGLKQSKADEKWLIVLTDGSEFSRNGSGLGSKTQKALEEELSRCVQDVNVMFLGIGKDAAMPNSNNIQGPCFYYGAKAEQSSQVLSKLTEMCNIIFGRDVLDISSSSVTFDVSMSKLILFVQGENITDVQLTGQSPTGTNTLKYSEKGSGGQGEDYFRVDKTLQGVMVTYGSLDAGTYTLSYSGNVTSITAYYEPEVDLQINLRDSEGNIVDPNGDLTEGTYYIEYMLVDKNGNPTTSQLLGNVNYKITYTINGQEYVVEANKAGKTQIDLKHNDTLDAKFQATYLDGYNIYKTSADLRWPSGGLTFGPPAAGALTMQISGGQDSYKLTQFKDGAVYRLQFAYEGAALSAEQLQQLNINITLDGGNATARVEQDSQGYYVKVDPCTNFVDTQAGQYTLNVSATFVNEYSQQVQASASTTFQLEDDSGALKLHLDVPQDYFVKSKLSSGKPIRIDVTLSGAPLTDAQLDQLELECNVKGLELKITPLYGESAFLVKILSDPAPDTGSYKIRFTAKTVNEIGRQVQDSASTKVQIRTLPLWLAILLPLLILLILFLLIWAYMNMKVLPKRLRMTDIEFYVDGDMVEASAKNIKFSGGGKSRGSLTIASPDFPDMRANVGMRVTVAAVSPRRVKSTKRKMRVIGISPTVVDGVKSYTLGGNSFDLDPIENVFVAAGSEPGDAFKPFNIGSNADVNINKNLDSGFSVNFDCKIIATK